MKRAYFRKSLNKSSALGWRSFCPIRAVLKAGNTYSIPPFSELSPETKSLAASACRFVQRFLRKLAAAALAAALAASPAFAAGEAYHPAYLSGFPDGSIRPEAALTREQLAQALYRLIPEERRAELDAPVCFSDVPPSRWSSAAVTAMVNLGVLYGTGEGKFAPEAGVTGPELAAALMCTAASEIAREFLPELAAAWDAQICSFEAGGGWVMGLDGTRFAPEQPLTRGRFAVILNGILGRTPQSVDSMLVGMPLWNDNLDTEAAYFLALQEAGTTHTADPDGTGEKWTGLG